MTDLATIAGELYALDIDAFTAERNRRARELRDTDRELSDAVAALPKPSASAWLVDQLVRAEPDIVADALALGPALRAAQVAFDRDALRELGVQRRAALSVVADAARRVGAARGRPVSTSIGDDVEQTILAGMLDQDAAAAVRSGRLVRTLQSIGGETVDLDGAVAAPGEELAERGAAARPARRTPPEPNAPDRAEKTRAEVAAAQREAAAARDGLQAADDKLAAAVERHEALAAERDDALAEYERLEREVGDAERARREAIRERDRANRRAEGAERVVGRAQAKLDELGS